MLRDKQHPSYYHWPWRLPLAASAINIRVILIRAGPSIWPQYQLDNENVWRKSLSVSTTLERRENIPAQLKVGWSTGRARVIVCSFLFTKGFHSNSDKRQNLRCKWWIMHSILQSCHRWFLATMHVPQVFRLNRDDGSHTRENKEQYWTSSGGDELIGALSLEPASNNEVTLGSTPGIELHPSCASLTIDDIILSKLSKLSNSRSFWI